MIRFVLILSLVLICGFYLKIGYDYQGQDLALGWGILGLLAGAVFVVEVWWGRRYKEYLIAILLGTLVGSLIFNPCIQWLRSLSFLSPVLEGVPWPTILKIFLIGLGILLVVYWSQEGFSRKVIHAGASFEVARNFLRLRWAIRWVLILSFFALVIFSLDVGFRTAGFEGSKFLEMEKLGYDFNLRVERTVALPSLSLWGVFVLLIFSEWIWGNFYLRRLWALLPVAGFVMVMGGVGIEILGIKMSHYLPSDLFQLFFLVLCGYLGFSWCVRAMRTGNYRLPFCRIDFGD